MFIVQSSLNQWCIHWFKRSIWFV